jgi:hypothetical protein
MYTVNKICTFLVVVLIYAQGFAQNGFSTANSTFKDFGQYSMHPLTTGSSGVNAFNGYDNNTKGRRYYFDNWVKGSVISNTGNEINSTDYFFNFDKVTNNLLVTKDKKEIVEVNKESLKEIHFNDKGIDYDFIIVEKITPDKFVEVIVKNDKVSLYKTINTHFVKANYTTNGLTETGNAYDEYVDAPAYYISYKGDLRPVIMKFKSIKSGLKEESKKVNDFYADHMNDEVDETYLKNIVFFINQ